MPSFRVHTTVSLQRLCIFTTLWRYINSIIIIIYYYFFVFIIIIIIVVVVVVVVVVVISAQNVQTHKVPWLSGRTLVFDRRAFAVLRSTYS